MAVSHVFSNAVADWTGTVTVFNSAGATGTVAATNLVRPQDWNSVHNQFYTLTGNTVGNTTASGTNVLIAGSGNVSVGGSTGSLVISGPVVDFFASGNLQPDLKHAAIAQDNSSCSITPFFLQNHLVFSNVRMLFSLNVASAGNTSAAYVDISASMVIYTRTGSTLSSVTSYNNTFTASWNSNNTASHAGINEIALTGNATTLTAGSYWAAFLVSTNNTATGGANTTALGNTMSMFGVSQADNPRSYHIFGQASNTSQGMVPGLGVLNTGATRASLAFSDYTQAWTQSNTAMAAQIYFELRNNTWQ